MIARKSRRVALLVVVAATFLAMHSPANATPTKKKDTHPAPSFLLPTSTGTVALDSLPAEVFLVDFWASWCGPCQRSFPWMEGMQKRYGAKGLSIIAINVDKKREDADRFLEKHPATFTVAYDPEGTTAKAFRVKGMPTTFLIGKDRTVLLSHAGFDSKHSDEIEAMVRQACAP